MVVKTTGGTTQQFRDASGKAYWRARLTLPEGERKYLKPRFTSELLAREYLAEKLSEVQEHGELIEPDMNWGLQKKVLKCVTEDKHHVYSRSFRVALHCALQRIEKLEREDEEPATTNVIEQIAAWLRAGASEAGVLRGLPSPSGVRTRDFVEKIMLPICKQLADQIERGDWSGGKDGS